MFRPTNAACGPARRPAFTLIELIVVIAIVVILACLFVCAVQTMREQASREKCRNNLKQICLAAHNYESAYKNLPPGLVGAMPQDNPNSMNFPNHGPLPFLIPYIESDNITRQYEQYTGGTPVVIGGIVFDNDPQSPKYWPDNEDKQMGHPQAAWWNNATNFRLAQSKVSIFLCPADHAYSNTQFTSICTIAGQNQFVNILLPVDQGGANLGRTNYIGNAGAIGYTADVFYQKYIGPFSSRSKAKLSNMYDGTSYTFLFGETLGGESQGERTRALSWMGAGAMPTAYGLPVKSFSWNFSSRHAGVVQFGMGDGSVQRIRLLDDDGREPGFFSETWFQFQRLGGMQEVVGTVPCGF
jgi:prepilin-type N-terminal cleavage/methylation domain-containing protein